jgi:hypothetical protein
LGTNAVVPAGLPSEPRGPPIKIIQLVPLLPQGAYAKAVMLLTKETGDMHVPAAVLYTLRWLRANMLVGDDDGKMEYMWVC